MPRCSSSLPRSACSRSRRWACCAAAGTGPEREPAALPRQPGPRPARRPEMGYLRAFGAFVGDDWLVAAGVVAALAATFALSQVSVAAWWLLPAMLAVLLPVSLRRAIRKR